MAYRETEQIRARKESQRSAILEAARARIAAGGYQAAQMQSLAADAGIATGTVYRYFDSKAELFAEVFRTVVRAEVHAVDAAAHGAGAPAARLRAVVETFVHRALRAPRLAYALLAEPVDPLVESERLLFRHTYAGIIEAVLRDGIAAGDFAEQDPRLTAAALVGLMSETLVGPLSPYPETETMVPPHDMTERQLIEAIVALCLRAVTAQTRAMEDRNGLQYGRENRA